MDHLYRSQLATPANSPERIDEALDSDADQIFFDLEDSLHASEKVEARRNLVEVVQTYDWGEKPLSYRMNGVRTRWWYDDVIEVVGAVGDALDSIIVPKVRDSVDVQTVETLLEQVEVNAGLETGAIELMVQIEDATAMGNVERIAHASDRLDAVIFGPGDYSTSLESKGQVLGVNTDYPGHYWHYPLSRIAHAAASADLRTIDGLYTNVDDVEGFRETCRYARMLGYDGKWVIHPDQTAAANELFAPNEAEVRRARRIIETYEDVDPNGVPTVDGRVVDEETVSMARHIVERARLAGVI